MIETTTFQIDASLAQAILEYLSKRPYIEVFNFISALRNLQPVVKPEPKLLKKDGAEE